MRRWVGGVARGGLGCRGGVAGVVAVRGEQGMRVGRCLPVGVGMRGALGMSVPGESGGSWLHAQSDWGGFT